MLRFLTAIFSAINTCVAELCSGAALAFYHCGKGSASLKIGVW